MMKLFVLSLLLNSITALRLSMNLEETKPLCMTASDTAGVGQWKYVKPGTYDESPPEHLRANITELSVGRKGCKEKKFMYEPDTCRLPAYADDVPVKPKRVYFMGDSVTDLNYQSFAWFYQKESVGTAPKPCGFHGYAMKKLLTDSGRFDEKTISDTIEWMKGQYGGTHKHQWSGCQDSKVLYVPVMKLSEGEPKNPNVIKAMMYAVKTFGEGEPMGPDDVLVMNWGLHGYKEGGESNMHHMDRFWTPSLTLLLKEIGEWQKNGTAPKVIWRQITPQHWQTSNGNWKPEVVGVGCKSNNPEHCVRGCTRLAKDAPGINLIQKNTNTYPSRNDNMFRKAVENAGLEIDGKNISFLPIWQPTALRFDEHAVGDCSHYCLYSAVHRYWNSAILATASSMLTV